VNEVVLHQSGVSLVNLLSQEVEWRFQVVVGQLHVRVDAHSLAPNVNFAVLSQSDAVVESTAHIDNEVFVKLHPHRFLNKSNFFIL